MNLDEINKILEKIILEWQTNKDTFGYGSHEDLIINDILVGNASYNSSRSKNDSDNNTYVGHILLPATIGKQYKEVYAPTMEEVKKKVEAIVAKWFIRIFKKEK